MPVIKLIYRRFIFPYGVLSLLLFIFSHYAAAQSSVWKISNGDRVLYIGGTIHILGHEDYPLPLEFEQAYKVAEIVVFETDIAAIRSPQFAREMMRQMLYPPGESLKDALDEQTYTRLAEYFSDKVPMSQIDGLKPAMVAVMLSALEFQRLGMVIEGVDEHFWERAQQDQKPAIALETVGEQLSYIVNMGKGKENEMISNALDDIQRNDSTLLALKKAWREGDRMAIKALFLQEMMEDYPELYQDLLVSRNTNWLPVVQKLLETDDVELILVGTLHLVGEEGLLRLLKKKGYTISPF